MKEKKEVGCDGAKKKEEQRESARIGKAEVMNGGQCGRS